MARVSNYYTGKGPRREPQRPLGPRGPVFHDLRAGDRVRVIGSGRTGVIVSDRGVHGEKLVRWDHPLFGVVEGWVAWPNLEPAGPVYTIEPERATSTHVGMVFGQFVNDADRPSRIARYWVVKDGQRVMWYARKREAQAYIERVQQ